MEYALNIAAAALGALASTLLGLLLFQGRGQRKDLQALDGKLDVHILEITRAMALKVDVGGCRTIREDCIGLNHKIIKEPLEARIAEINRKRAERWQQQAEENKKIWTALTGHSHTAFADPVKAERDKVIFGND